MIGAAMRRNETTFRLRSNADELRAAGVASLYMFGSTARDDANSDSDVDLFFDPADPRLNLFGVMAVRDAVEALLGCRADVMTRNSLHPYLRSRIEAEALQIF